MKRATALLVTMLLLVLILASCAGPGEFVDREDIASRYIEAFIAQDYRVLGNFHMTFKMKWSLNNRAYKSIKDQIEEEFGAFEEVVGIEEYEYNGYMVVSQTSRFKNMYGDLNILFDDQNRIAGFRYAYNKTYQENDTSYDVIFGTEFPLPGSLLIPNNEKAVPAVIIVHGSGPSNRDGEIGGSAVYFDLAVGLERKGIASLRYDKRTYVYTDAADYDMSEFTVYDETIDDVVSAYKFLSVQPGIDSERIYIIGHSLGGYLIPRIAEELPEAAGFVMIAPNASPIEDLMVLQTEYLYGLDGNLSKTEKKGIQAVKDTAEIIRNLQPGDNYASSELFNAPVSYWLDLQNYNPVLELRNVERPVIIIHGDRDYQVNTSEYERWKDTALNLANVRSVLIPGLNHLMAYGDEQSTPQEYYLLSEVDQTVIDSIAEFIDGK